MDVTDSGVYPLRAVPLFPLPGVVLFPRAILPLHIFEERYKEMTRDVLAGDHLLAMALLRPGWEKRYYGHPAIEPVVCVGKIVANEKLPDGRYNFLLQGQTRARIVRELSDTGQSYRMADLEPIEETPVLEIDLSPLRDRLDRIFADDSLGGLPMGKQFQPLLHGVMTTAEIADVLAFSLLEDVTFKQSLLAEKDVKLRVGRIISAIERMLPVLRPNVDDSQAGLN